MMGQSKIIILIILFYHGHRPSMVGLWPSSSLSTGCVVSLRGLSHFPPFWLRIGWQSMIRQKYIILYYDILNYIILYYDILYYIILYYIILYYIIL